MSHRDHDVTHLLQNETRWAIVGERLGHFRINLIPKVVDDTVR